MTRWLAGALVLLATTAGAMERFFVMGDGSVTVTNVHTGEKASVVYRRPDGTYDEEALRALARVFRSRDGKVGDMTVRFVEVLSHVEGMSGKPLRLMSGYRSPAYNQGLRKAGRKAASGSLHTEGMAADLTFPKGGMKDLWLAIRALDCCGAGYYAGNGFLHVDVGVPRFWEAHTSKVDENLSEGNARVFARTEYDRYAAGEPLALRLHAVTAPPIRIAGTARLLADDGGEGPAVRIQDTEAPDLQEGCIEVDADSRLRVLDAPAVERRRVVLETCEPRPERTPPQIRSNPVTIR